MSTRRLQSPNALLIRIQGAHASRSVCVVLGLLMECAGCGAGSSPAPLPAPITTAPPIRHDITDVTTPPAERSSAPVEPSIAEPAPPQVVYRPPDRRRQHDDAKLAALGIYRYESQRLRLYTDVDSEKVRELPRLTDQLYDTLVAYFGPLPPARDATEYQMTGYLISDLALFRETGLVPDDLPTFEHGRHRANEFWLRDQEFDYYRAHLLFHEATHCFMTVLPEQEVNVWYMEGMAEYFATHRRDDQGKLQFGIMPQFPEEVAGWGRITLVRQAFSQDDFQTVPQLFELTPREFITPLPYAWSWGLGKFLCAHPRYAARFQRLGQTARDSRFAQQFRETFAADSRDLATEWMLFVVNLQYGYDIPRAAIEFRRGAPLISGMPPLELSIVSDRGWQSSEVELQQGATYTVAATGRITLADEPKPWISEPDGISIDYFDGQPIGTLLACLRSTEPQPTETMLRILPIGRERTFVAPLTGTLYLRVNDAWNRLADNRGSFTVTVAPSAP